VSTFIQIYHVWEGYLQKLKSTCDVNLLSKLSINFKEWRVMNNVDRGGVIVLFVF
jgi:hypothetical protein